MKKLLLILLTLVVLLVISNLTMADRYIIIQNQQLMAKTADVVNVLGGRVLHNFSIIPATLVDVNEIKSEYSLTPKEMTWKDAEAYAVKNGGHLVTINSEKEQMLLTAMFPENEYGQLWIGYNDIRQEGKWEWVSGEKSNYTNWFPGEPNNWNNDEDAATTNFMGKYWSDLSTKALRRGIIEKKSENAFISNMISSKIAKSVYKDSRLSAVGIEDELDRSWGVRHIGAGKVHKYNKGNEVKIGIIDSGIDYRHPDLRDNYAGGYDFVNNDHDPFDDNGHGTHVAGIASAIADGRGVVGVAPKARIYAIKALNSNGHGYLSDVIKSIEWAVQNGIQIINMSLGTSNDVPPLKMVCENAYNSGVLLVAAAGNERTNVILSPAKYDSVIAVTAIGGHNDFANFSSFGPEAELCAPGTNIRSTVPGNRYSLMDGTSMASPHVAGTAALVWSINPTWNNVMIRERLRNTADDIGDKGRDQKFGFGKVDADSAARNQMINVTRLYNDFDHYYATNQEAVKKAIGFGYRVEKETAFHVYKQNYTGTVPLYQFYLANGDHFYTTDEGEKNFVINVLGGIFEGSIGNVFSTSQTGTTPLYRLYKEEHFYTIDPIERDQAIFRFGYIDEGIACYVPTQQIGAPPIEKILPDAKIVKIKPQASILGQNFPNPFNPETWIPFQLTQSCDVRITINDALGRTVRTLNLGSLEAGQYLDRSQAAYWDGKNETGESVTSGIYFYTIQAGSFTATRKMIIKK